MRPRPIATLLLIAMLVLASGPPARSQVTPRATPYDAKAAFAETDKNGDGQIDVGEFHDRLVEVFYSADTNKDGFLSVEEFNRIPYPEGFKEADENGDGKISLKEFVHVRFRQFEDADTNHDGELSLDEVIVVFEGRKKQ